MKRLDVLVARKDEKKDKTYWTRIGVAFENDKGGYKLILDAAPLTGEMFLFPPREKSERREPGEDDPLPF